MVSDIWGDGRKNVVFGFGAREKRRSGRGSGIKKVISGGGWKLEGGTWGNIAHGTICHMW